MYHCSVQLHLVLQSPKCSKTFLKSLVQRHAQSTLSWMQPNIVLSLQCLEVSLADLPIWVVQLTNGWWGDSKLQGTKKANTFSYLQHCCLQPLNTTRLCCWVRQMDIACNAATPYKLAHLAQSNLLHYQTHYSWHGIKLYGIMILGLKKYLDGNIHPSIHYMVPSKTNPLTCQTWQIWVYTIILTHFFLLLSWSPLQSQCFSLSSST